MKLQLFAFVFLMISSFSYGQISTERPGNADNPTTLPKNTLQVETGIQGNFTNGRSSETILPNVMLRLGLSNTIEVRLITNLIKTKTGGIENSSSFNMSDLTLSAKVWLGEWDNSNLAVVGYLTVPSGNGSGDDYGYQGRLSYGHDLCESVGVLANLGYSYDGKIGDFLYSLVFSKSAGDAGVFIELYGDSDNTFADTGVTYAISKTFQVDMSFGIGLTQKGTNYLGVGAAWMFK